MVLTHSHRNSALAVSVSGVHKLQVRAQGSRLPASQARFARSASAQADEGSPAQHVGGKRGANQKQRSKQINKQANKQTYKQASKQARKQASKQAGEQASKQTSKQARKRANEQRSKQIWRQSVVLGANKEHRRYLFRAQIMITRISHDHTSKVLVIIWPLVPMQLPGRRTNAGMKAH